jgi:hypothetical protein
VANQAPAIKKVEPLGSRFSLADLVRKLPLVKLKHIHSLSWASKLFKNYYNLGQAAQDSGDDVVRFQLT